MSPFNLIQKKLRAILKEIEMEILIDSPEITEEQFKELMAMAKRTQLTNMGVDLDWYEEQEKGIKEWSKNRKKEKRQEITKEIEKAKEEVVSKIPEIPAPVIKTEIVKEIIKEKPQVVRTEVRTERVIDRTPDRTETAELKKDLIYLQETFAENNQKILDDIKVAKDFIKDIDGTVLSKLNKELEPFAKEVHSKLMWLHTSLQGQIDSLKSDESTAEVNKIIAGTGITISPTTGIGDVTITNSLDLSGYVPYTGATGAVNLGSQNLTTTGTGTFGQIIDSGLTASKVVFTDGSKQLTSTGIGTSSQFIKGDGSLDSSTYLTAEADTLASVCGRGASYTAGNVTLLGITIGANTLNTDEWAYLDGQNQAVKTTSSPSFVGLTLSGLTATRVPFFGTGGLISSSANFTFNSGTDALTVSGMTFDAGSITDASGTISFGNENLTTTGLVAIGTTTVAGRLINVLGSGAVTGSYFANTLTAAAQTTYGFQNILASGGSAIDGGGRIQYGIYNSITNTAGNGASGYPKMYGVYNYLRNTGGVSNAYGVYNDFAVSTTNCTATGLYNTYSVTSGSTLFGTENIGTSTAGKLGGTNNTLTVTNHPSAGETWGTYNSFSLTGTTADNDTYGTYNTINLLISGANFFYGHYNYLSVGNYTNTICGDYTSLSDAGLSATSYGNYIYMYFGGKGSLSDPTVNKIGLYVDNGVVAGTDANNKAWAIYNNSSATTSGKVFLGADNRITYWGTGLDLKIYHDGTNSLIQNITGKLILGTPSILEIGTGAAGVDYILQVKGETNDGIITWMEDEDYFKFSDDIMMLGGENIVLDTATGTKIGTSTSQLLGFYNATPVNQPDTVSDAATQDLTGTDTIDKTKTEADLTSCKNAINAIIDRLQELGLIA